MSAAKRKLKRHAYSAVLIV